MEELNNELNDLIDYIKNTDDYKKCVLLKKQMDENDEVKKLVDDVKRLQKKYIRSNYDKDIKKELDIKNDELNNIPVFVIYNQSLEKVNVMIDYVRDSLNIYFDNLLNKKNRS